MQATLEKLEKSREFWFLFITSFVFFILRLPSLFEPYWYGDEGVYQVLGLGIRHGRLLYQGIWDNKPPLLYLIYALFNSNQFLVRSFSAVVGILTVLSFFYLARLLFVSKESEKKHQQITVCISTALFAFLFGIPLIEGNIANAENFMLFPVIVAGYFIYKQNMEHKNLLYYAGFFLPGLFLGIAFLFKIVAVFDFAAFAGFLFIIHFGINKLKQTFEILVPFAIGFFLPLIFTILFFFFKGAFFDFVHAALIQNVGYVGYGNTFIIPQGLLILKLLVLGLFTLFLLLKKKSIPTHVLFVLIWFAFSLFNAFFSQRPYTHYVLTVLPSFSLLIGLIFLEKKFKIPLSILMLISLVLLIKNFTYFGKTIYYYQNFAAFITNKETTFEYRNFFDSNTPHDYQLADYLNSHMKNADNVFIWGNNAQVYKLIDRLPPGRYTVAYHITASAAAINETGKALSRVHPRFIVISEKQLFPYTLFGYLEKMSMDETTIYERSF